MEKENIDYFYLYDEDKAKRVTDAGEKTLDSFLKNYEREMKRELLEKKLKRIRKYGKE
jgi:hypothetical protein